LSPKPCRRHDVALIGFEYFDDVLVAINVNDSTVASVGELVAVGWVVLTANDLPEVNGQSLLAAVDLSTVRTLPGDVLGFSRFGVVNRYLLSAYGFGVGKVKVRGNIVLFTVTTARFAQDMKV
jgi:hypothetical protein